MLIEIGSKPNPAPVTTCDLPAGLHMNADPTRAFTMCLVSSGSKGTLRIVLMADGYFRTVDSDGIDTEDNNWSKELWLPAARGQVVTITA